MALLRGATRRCCSTDAAQKVDTQKAGWGNVDKNPFTPYSAEYNEWKYGKHTPVPQWGESLQAKGPAYGREPAADDYLGNCKTPAWLFGENGEEWLEKCKTLFKGYEPTRKKSVANFTMRLQPGKVTAGPPVGPTFSQEGVKSIDFVKAINDATAGVFLPDPGLKLKVYLRFYEDKTYQWRILPPPTMWLITRAAGLPFRGKGGIGASAGIAVEGKMMGYLSLQQVYHIAAVANTWQHYADWVPLEQRVATIIRQAHFGGIAVLGVHTPAPPVLGMSDAQYKEYIEEQKEKWDEERRKELDLNPLERLPWITRRRGENEGHELDGSKTYDAKALIKDAAAVNAAFQKKTEPTEESSNADKHDIFWDTFNDTGRLEKSPRKKLTTVEQRAVDENIAARVHHIKKAYPAMMAKSPHYGAMWWSEEWEQYQSSMFEGMNSRIR